jgi:hypothetical protein
VEANVETVRERLEARWKRLGFEVLLQEEREFIVLWWLEMEVIGGGLDQYFENSAGDGALEALGVLDALGAKVSARALRDALDAFGVGGYSADRSTRQKRLREVSPKCTAFDGPTRVLQEGPREDFVTIALDRVEKVYTSEGLA